MPDPVGTVGTLPGNDFKRIRPSAALRQKGFSEGSCVQCPRKCLASRPGDRGLCGAGRLRIASRNLHFGEEPPISGTKGSGTVFFSGCSLKCIFCQNYPISVLNNGEDISIDDLAGIMLELQDRGAHNINLVTPTHYSVEIAQALVTAKRKGLGIPVVFNTSGYDRVEILRTLEGLIDVYLPDAKYSSREISLKYCECGDYHEVNRKALLEMKRQSGDLIIKKGVAIKGILIRHLVIPGEIPNSENVLEWIYGNMGNVHLSLMSQYLPCHKAPGHDVINRRLNSGEYNRVMEFASRLGFTRGYSQPL